MKRFLNSRGVGLAGALTFAGVGLAVGTGFLELSQVTVRSAQIENTALSEQRLKRTVHSLLSEAKECAFNLKPSRLSDKTNKKGKVVSLIKTGGNNIGTSPDTSDDTALITSGERFGDGLIHIVKMELIDPANSNQKERTFKVYYKKPYLGDLSTLSNAECSADNQEGCYFLSCNMDYSCSDVDGDCRDLTATPPDKCQSSGCQNPGEISLTELTCTGENEYLQGFDEKSRPICASFETLTQELACPDGQFLKGFDNEGRPKCEIMCENHNTSHGFIYGKRAFNSDLNRCECLGGSRYNTEQKSCICPGRQRTNQYLRSNNKRDRRQYWVHSNNRCECLRGKVWYSDSEECKCPAGWIWNRHTNMCVESCTSPYPYKYYYGCHRCPEATPYYHSGGCQSCPSYTPHYHSGKCNFCPINTPKRNGSSCVTCSAYNSATPKWNGSKCVSCSAYDSATPRWDGSNCVACSSSTPKWNGSSCVTCSAYDSATPRWDGSNCVACPSGQSWNGSNCVCPSGKPHYHHSGCHKCKSRLYYNSRCNACPSGYTLSNGGCCPHSHGTYIREADTCCPNSYPYFHGSNCWTRCPSGTYAPNGHGSQCVAYSSSSSSSSGGGNGDGGDWHDYGNDDGGSSSSGDPGSDATGHGGYL